MLTFSHDLLKNESPQSVGNGGNHTEVFLKVDSLVCALCLQLLHLEMVCTSDG
jgi:hypothetical protein